MTKPPKIEAPKEKPSKEPSSIADGEEQGRYVYCIIDSCTQLSFEKRGVEESKVYTLVYKDIGAAVHRCAAEPYTSGDREVVKKWVLAHQDVVEEAWRKFGTVLPSTFDTIVKGGDKGMEEWLRDNYDVLKDKIRRVRGRSEFGVQILFDPKAVAQTIVDKDGEIKMLSQEMERKDRGLRYLYRQKIEKEVQRKMEAWASKRYRSLYRRVGRYAEEVKVEKIRRSEGRRMLMNLALLMEERNVKPLGEELAKIQRTEGLGILLTGPWPPYSFV